MAGIGFELRKLARRDDLAGVLQGYFHSAFASGGPWLFTIIALAAIVILGSKSSTPRELASFRLVVIYNFAFSLVLTGPVAIITTRYLADGIHNKDVREAPAAMLGALAIVYATQVWIAAPFYLVWVEMEKATRLAALANYFLVAGIWVVSVFLTALKNYRAVSASFAAGMAVAILAAGALAPDWSVTGMLAGFNLGLALILFTLMARVFAEYPTAASRPLAILGHFRKYWPLALSGLAYNLGIWIDKWIMWLSPARETMHTRMVSCPDYESAMFLAYLSIIPSMAAFTMTVETAFFENYLNFYRDILRHATYARIERNQQELTRPLLDGARDFLVLQGAITAAGILLAPRLFEILEVNFGQLGIFRLGLVGAFFHSGFLYLTIVLSYFDLRRPLVGLYALFLAANGLLTWLSMEMGFRYYGFGYFLASVIAFSAAFLVAARFLRDLPYQTFIVHNTSVQ